jgi:hypothetical protein
MRSKHYYSYNRREVMNLCYVIETVGETVAILNIPPLSYRGEISLVMHIKLLYVCVTEEDWISSKI